MERNMKQTNTFPGMKLWNRDGNRSDFEAYKVLDTALDVQRVVRVTVEGDNAYLTTHIDDPQAAIEGSERMVTIARELAQHFIAGRLDVFAYAEAL
jgi:hypothetical protein